MIEFDERELLSLSQEAERSADAVGTLSKKGRRGSIYEAIEDAVDGEIQNPILREARARASKHVGSDRANTIRPVDGSWSGDTYTAGLTSDNVVVLSHERGTGSHSSGGPYEIRPDTGDKLVFQSGGSQISVNYTVHPGVRGKQFMQKSVNFSMEDMVESVLDEIDEVLNDAVSNN